MNEQEKQIIETAICLGCGFADHPDNFKPCISVYHDLRCPNCGTSEIDTSALNAAWKARGEFYGFGDNNTLKYDPQ
jgi:predicted Zn-ribbon and HTH transcriptional regulator